MENKEEIRGYNRELGDSKKEKQKKLRKGNITEESGLLQRRPRILSARVKGTERCHSKNN
jgi:hypothetical protein